jgi:hypothetical protein
MIRPEIAGLWYVALECTLLMCGRKKRMGGSKAQTWLDMDKDHSG